MTLCPTTVITEVIAVKASKEKQKYFASSSDMSFKFESQMPEILNYMLCDCGTSKESLKGHSWIFFFS